MQADHHEIPKWLKQIQENSWELELLISGGAIFSLYQLSDQFLSFSEMVKFTGPFPGINLMLIMGMFGLKMITFGFTFHLISRAFWLGLVCVNYVFPSGIKRHKIKREKPFGVDAGEGQDMRTQILSVDRLCGMIMYLSIMSSFMVLGIVLMILVFVTFPATLTGGTNVNAAAGIFLLITLVYLIDLFSSGGLRRIPYLSYVLFPLLKLVDLVSLRFVYQHSLWLFGTNIRKWRFALGFSVFIITGAFFTYTTIYRVMNWPNIVDEREYRWQMAAEDKWWSRHTYRDEMNQEEVHFYKYPNIQSDIIHENYLRLFVPYSIEYDQSIAQLPAGGQFLSNIFEVSIDDSTYTIEWLNSWHEHNEQIGIRANIDIRHLDNGRHNLNITDVTGYASGGLIPFWKDTK